MGSETRSFAELCREHDDLVTYDAIPGRKTHDKTATSPCDLDSNLSSLIEGQDGERCGPEHQSTDEAASVLIEDEVAFITEDRAAPAQVDTVLLDSAASSHYLFDSDAPLSTSGLIHTDTKVTVKGAKKGSGMECRGRMGCKLKVSGGSELELDRVLLLPGDVLQHRLASIGQLTRAGYGLMFYGDTAVVVRDGKTVLTTKRTANNLYPIQGTNLPPGLEGAAAQGESAMRTVDENGDTEQYCYLATSYYVGTNFAQLPCQVQPRVRVKGERTAREAGLRIWAPLHRLPIIRLFGLPVRQGACLAAPPSQPSGESTA